MSDSDEKTLAQSTLFAEDSHVSHTVTQASNWVQKITAPSGLNIAGLSKNSGPLGLLEKMLLGWSGWSWIACLPIWRAWATPGGRLIFQLVPLAHHTNDAEYGLLPTVRANSAMASNLNTEANLSSKRNPNLETVLAHLLPTIGANEFKGASKVRFRGSVEFRGAKMAEGVRFQETDPIYLNPQFAELMMGYEPDYTLLETPLSRKSRKSSGGQL